jgi:hypothetical protein
MLVEMHSRKRKRNRDLWKKTLHAAETMWLWSNYAFIDPKARCSPPKGREKKEKKKKVTLSCAVAAGKSLREDSNGSQRRPSLSTLEARPRVCWAQSFEEPGTQGQASG